MPVLVREGRGYEEGEMRARYGIALDVDRLRLLSGLSGGLPASQSAARRLPAPMLEPTSFDETDSDEELRQVHRVPVDETEDDDW